MTRKKTLVAITSQGSIIGKKPVFIPELRMTVFTKAKETPLQTRERYLNKHIADKITYKKG